MACPDALWSVRFFPERRCPFGSFQFRGCRSSPIGRNLVVVEPFHVVPGQDLCSVHLEAVPCDQARQFSLSAPLAVPRALEEQDLTDLPGHYVERPLIAERR